MQRQREKSESPSQSATASECSRQFGRSDAKAIWFVPSRKARPARSSEYKHSSKRRLPEPPCVVKRKGAREGSLESASKNYGGYDFSSRTIAATSSLL